ncbi:threo-3-hydroxy-L-aspartate ammonia-lyase [Pararhizobium mangrovi]|uniref:threo-3-hydroxy-L-aspartate ammonia-lyase n=1 Tax=Pararhizobium mangrovi TaxID=2590452 RepID=UPI001AEEB84B|nr:threo-3-hydroxy-L-aspartate ammonia-lyase [Pararhizobium mangrovi]
MSEIPTFDDVAAASRRIEGHAAHTPVLTSRTADAMLGARLFFKCENFQRTGAFKFRGAFNALSNLDAAARAAGVVTFSSGNHAQAIARSAAMLGMAATIVMPEDAPASKVAATRGYGARIVTYDRYAEDREAIGLKLSQEEGLTLVPPYDHADIVAGQGTAAKELFEEVGELDALFVCLGGGGLLSGSLLSACALSPACKVFGVEPEAGNDGQRSLQSGEIVRIEAPRTIADGAQTLALGRIPFAIIRERCAGITTVTDAALVEAMRFFAARMKIVVEPTGCLSFCGAERMADEWRDARIGILVSGGNVDVARLSTLLSE